MCCPKSITESKYEAPALQGLSYGGPVTPSKAGPLSDPTPRPLAAGDVCVQGALRSRDVVTRRQLANIGAPCCVCVCGRSCRVGFGFGCASEPIHKQCGFPAPMHAAGCSGRRAEEFHVARNSCAGGGSARRCRRAADLRPVGGCRYPPIGLAGQTCDPKGGAQVHGGGCYKMTSI